MVAYLAQKAGNCLVGLAPAATIKVVVDDYVLLSWFFCDLGGQPADDGVPVSSYVRIQSFDVPGGVCLTSTSFCQHQVPHSTIDSFPLSQRT
jgi:hypothetical protein